MDFSFRLSFRLSYPFHSGFLINLDFVSLLSDFEKEAPGKNERSLDELAWELLDFFSPPPITHSGRLAMFKLFSLTLILSLLLLVFPSISTAAPSFPLQVILDNSLLGCPSMKIRCVKGSVWPSGIVGDIGVKEFVWIAPRCQQADVSASSNLQSKRGKEGGMLSSSSLSPSSSFCFL